MAFPNDPQMVEVGLFIDGQWVDAASNGNGVRENDAISITHGRSDWASVADPGRAAFTLDNRDGRWSPDYTGSPYSGKLRRNIPCRIGVKRGEAHLRPTDLSYTLASTPDVSGGGGGGTPTAPSHVSLTSSEQNSFVTTHPVTLPTVVVGDRLLLVIAAGHNTLEPKDQGGGATDLDGWTLVISSNLYTPWHGWLVYEIEIANSSLVTAFSGASVEFSTDVATKSSAQVLRTSGVRSGGSGTAWAVAGPSASVDSATPDPPSLTTPWATEPNRWYTFSVSGTGGDTITGYPASWTAIGQTGATNTLMLHSAHRTTTAQTENPGVFTLSGAENWQTFTFAYRGIEVAGTDGVLDISGDIDVRIEFELEKDLVDISQGGKRARLAHKSSGADGWEMGLYTALGKPVCNFTWRDSSGVQRSITTEQTGAALPYDFYHEHRAIRFDFDVNNGASGHTAVWYTANTIAGPWVQLGAPVVVSGVTSIKTNDAALRVAGNPADNPAAYVPFPGKVYAFDLRNSSDVVVANPRFNSQTPGATSFTDSAGRTWTVGTGGRISNSLWRFHGELSSLPVRWNIDGSDVTAPVEASGLFRRLRQGNRLIESALRRAIVRSGVSVVQYWPMEEEGDGTITQFGPAIGTSPMLISGGVPNTSSQDVFYASSPLPTLGTASVAATVDSYPATSVWQVRWLQYVPPTFTGDNFRYFRVETSDITWEIEYRDDVGGQLQIHGLRGLSTVYSSGWTSFNVTGKAWRMTLSVRQSGSAVTVSLFGQSQDGGAGGITLTNATTGSSGSVNRIQINRNLDVGSWAFGHVTVQSASTSLSELETQLNAYTGERAGRRIQRLLNEEGIAYRIEGDPDGTETMGPQRPDTLMNLLQECADTDLGVLHESREAVAVGYRTRASMLDQPVLIGLDYEAGQVAGSPELDRDDQGFSNDVTVTNRAGNTARAVKDDGSPISISEPPVGAGRYDSRFRVNCRDDRLATLAATRLALSAVDEPRVSRLQVALHHPALSSNVPLTSAIFDSSLGDRLRIVNNLPLALGTKAIDQLVQGTREVITSFTHTIDMVTSPSSPWFTSGVPGGGGGGVAPPAVGQQVRFRTQQSLATPGSPPHVLTRLGYTSTELIDRVDLDTILDDWLVSTGGTLRTYNSSATWATAIAAARPGDLVRGTGSFTVSSGQLSARGTLYGLSGSTMTASPSGGTAELPIIITTAAGVEITGSGLTNNVPVLDIVNTRHVWAVGFNISGTSQFGIRLMNAGGSAGNPAYVAYNRVDEIRDAAIAAQGWFQLITASGGTPPAGSGNEWGFSEWLVVEENDVYDPNPGDVAGNPGEGVYMGRGASPAWVSYAKDFWVRGNRVRNYKGNGYEAKPGCHRGRFTDNVAVAGRAQNGAAFEMCYLFSGADNRPAWMNNLDGAGSADIQIYCEGNRVYDYNITETGATRNQAFILGMAGVRIANNMLWSARDSSGDSGPADDLYAVLIQSEKPLATFGNPALVPTLVINNNWQARGVTNLGASDGAITGVIFRNNIVPTGYDGGQATADADDYIAATPAPGVLSPAEWNQATGSWRVTNGRTYKPDGGRYTRAGFNGGVHVDVGGAATVLFGGPGKTTGKVAWAWDGFPGDFNVSLPMHPTAATDQYSSTISGFGSFEDRVHAMTGYRSPAAIAAGVTNPAWHWHVGTYRICALLRDQPGITWNTASYMTPSALIPEYLDRIRELIALGIVVAVQDHGHTGTDPDIPVGAQSNPLIDINDPAIAGSGNQRFRDTIQFYDAICAAFPGGSANVWLGLPNEAHPNGRDAKYDRWTKWWLQRIRGKGFTGIVTVPLPIYAGALGELAGGDLETLVDDLEAVGVGYNIRWELHAYGRNSDTGTVYTYAEIDAHLAACRDGVPGTGRKHSVWVSEVGQAVPVGTGAAGPDAWNRESVLQFLTDTYGQALGEKYDDLCVTWWSLGDNSFDVSYSLTRGVSNKTDETGPDPNTNGTPKGVKRWYEINTTALLAEWGSDGGKAFADIAERVWGDGAPGSYGPGSAFDLNPASPLVGSGSTIADLDLYIDADISQRPIPAATPNPGPFQPDPAA